MRARASPHRLQPPLNCCALAIGAGAGAGAVSAAACGAATACSIPTSGTLLGILGCGSDGRRAAAAPSASAASRCLHLRLQCRLQPGAQLGAEPGATSAPAG